MFRATNVYRLFLALALALLTVVSPLVGQVASADSTPWQVGVGAETPDQAVQANFYYPGSITIHVNDSVQWTWHAGEIHTVTFLNGHARPTDIGSAFKPYKGDSIPAADIVSSGATPKPFSYTLKFTQTGDFKYNCLVHETMYGWVHVVAAGAPLPYTQAQYDAMGHAKAAAMLGRGRGLLGQALAQARSAGPNQITAGIGKFFDDGSIGVMRFRPETMYAKVNEPVVWTARDPETPHTITFNLENPPADFNQFAPWPFVPPPFPTQATINSTTQDFSSGLITQQHDILGIPVVGKTFTIKFTSPGTYNYRCLLHDDLGMTGKIVVTQ